MHQAERYEAPSANVAESEWDVEASRRWPTTYSTQGPALPACRSRRTPSDGAAGPGRRFRPECSHQGEAPNRVTSKISTRAVGLQRTTTGNRSTSDGLEGPEALRYASVGVL